MHVTPSFVHARLCRALRVVVGAFLAFLPVSLTLHLEMPSSMRENKGYVQNRM